MNKKSILFIEPTGQKTNVFDNFMHQPLMGPLYLGTILFNQGYQVKIVSEHILGRQLDPFEIHADVFCITALTISANRARFLANQLKKIYPQSLLIIGGIHASLLAEEFAEVADHVVIGEAEDIIIDLVEGKFQEKIVNGSQFIDVEKIPPVNYGLIDDLENIDIIPIMTSRGCPFDCNFCTVTKIFGRRFRMQSPQRIIVEIENALRYFKKTSFFFYDDNFTANKKRVEEFCDLIIDKRIKISWTAQVRADIARDPVLIRKMVKAGLQWVYIGFESINDETLKSYHKAQTRKDIEQAIRTLHTYGVNIHGMFIFGEDHDLPEHISDTVQFAIANSIDTVQFMILTPFPGTQCFTTLEKERRIFHKNWDYYNGMFAVYQPKNMSPITLTNETYNAYRKFYSLRRTFLDTLFLIVNIGLDALVWNFGRVNRYGLNILFLRGGAKLIVAKYADLYTIYLKYIEDLERRKLAH